MKLRLAAPALLIDIGRLSRPVLRPGGRRRRRHRRPDPPPRPRDQRGPRSRTPRCWPTSPARSATRRSATAAPSAARSPTATRRRTCRPPAWPSAPPSPRSARRASARSRPPTSSSGFLETALAPDEVLTEIRVPKVDRRRAGRSRSSTGGPRTGPSSGVAAVAGPAAGRRPRQHGSGARCGPAPSRRPWPAGRQPPRRPPMPPTGLEPPADLNASPEYRRHLAQVLVRAGPGGGGGRRAEPVTAVDRVADRGVLPRLSVTNRRWLAAAPVPRHGLPGRRGAGHRRSSWPWRCTGRCCSRARPASARPRWPRCWPAWTGGELLRLQCYEGIDVSQAVYEWDYARQLLHLRAAEAGGDRRPDEDDVYSERFLVRRPLLRAIDHSTGPPPVLLIDEVDRADDEFEAFLLEFLSEYAVTVPELGTFRAVRAAARDHHLQPDPRRPRRPQAALPLPLGRAPRASSGRWPSSGCALPRRSRSWPARWPPRSKRCGSMHLYKPPGRGRVHRLGRGAGRARAAAEIDERTVDLTLGHGPQVPGGPEPGCGPRASTSWCAAALPARA